MFFKQGQRETTDRKSTLSLLLPSLKQTQSSEGVPEGDIPPGWPKGPGESSTTFRHYCYEVIIDFFLFSISCIFFVFGVLVRYHDQTPVASHRALASSLREATTYVRWLRFKAFPLRNYV